MEQIFVYRTSGGKNILSNLSNEVKPIVLTVLEGILKDGLENFTTRPIDKKITPTLYEIKKKDVSIFYYRGLDNTINIVYITEHKQKNKTEKTDKKTAVDREKRMLKNPLIHREHIQKIPPEHQCLRELISQAEVLRVFIQFRKNIIYERKE